MNADVRSITVVIIFLSFSKHEHFFNFSFYSGHFARARGNGRVRREQQQCAAVAGKNARKIFAAAQGVAKTRRTGRGARRRLETRHPGSVHQATAKAQTPKQVLTRKLLFFFFPSTYKIIVIYLCLIYSYVCVCVRSDILLFWLHFLYITQRLKCNRDINE